MRLSIGRELAILKRRAKLRNHDFSIISNTCIGGVMSHCVGEQFRSPTVNLVIYEVQFLLFCQNLKAYSKCPVERPTEEEAKKFASINYPVGILRGGELPDINLYFVHYSSFEEAKAKWEARFARVNYDDIFVIMDRGMDADDRILDAFHALPYEHKVFFTHKEDPARWPCNFSFSFYTPERYISSCLYNKVKKGPAQYYLLDEFDFVQWLNTGRIGRTTILDKGR